ncbi:MAG TPA: hypothetical protein VN310_08725 [Candidatus Dormibacteraeota bacterium]|nr:hypothetical protein [Candidatus Dormibacteraeota bacterium]
MNGTALRGLLPLVVLFLATTASAQNRPWCDSGLSRPAPQTSTAAELKKKLREAINTPDPMGNRLLPISLSITLSGTVQPDSVHQEHDEDITFCLKLDQQSQQNLQHELGVNARDLPTEIHMEILPYALDRSGNVVFPGWKEGKKDRVLFDGEPVRINTMGWSPQFDNLPGKEKRLDGKHIQVTGSLVVDPHESLRTSPKGSRCGPQGCLELHPVAVITLLNDPGVQ